jgi:glycosyltransferase involved in cell wall biosynthesis
MMLGRPVITSAKGSLEEVTGEAALLVDPYDVDDIARAITAIVSNPDLRDEPSRRGVAPTARFSSAQLSRARRVALPIPPLKAKRNGRSSM